MTVLFKSLRALVLGPGRDQHHTVIQREAWPLNQACLASLISNVQYRERNEKKKPEERT